MCCESWSGSSICHFENYIRAVESSKSKNNLFQENVWGSVSDALGVSGAPGDGQGTLKGVFQNSKVTIHRSSEVIVSPQGALAAPKDIPMCPSNANIEIKVAQNKSE